MSSTTPLSAPTLLFSPAALRNRLVTLEEILDAIGSPADVVLALSTISRAKADRARTAGDEGSKVAWNWTALELEDTARRLRERVNPYGKE